MITRRSCSILDEDNSTPKYCRRRNKPASSVATASPLYGGGSSPTTALTAKNPPSSRARPVTTRRLRSIGGRQPTDDKFDLVAGDLAPRFDLRHVGRFGEALEPFTRLGARFVARQAKGLAPPGVLCGGRVRTSAAPISDALSEIDWLLGPGRHPGPLRA